MAEIVYESNIEHSGIRGMKWGIRRFQNPDGSLTVAGRKRYGSGEQRYSGPATLPVQPKPKTETDNQNGVTKPVVTEKSPTNKRGLPESSSARSKSIHDMTDDELNSVLDRLTNEHKYRELTYKPTTMKKVGRYLKDCAKKPMHDLGEQLIAIGAETVTNKVLHSIGIVNGSVSLSKKKNDDKKKSDAQQIGKEILDSLTAAANEANKPKKPKK